MIADGLSSTTFAVGSTRPRDVGRKGRKQQIARKGLVEPSSSLMVVSTYATKPLSKHRRRKSLRLRAGFNKVTTQALHRNGFHDLAARGQEAVGDEPEAGDVD